MVNIVAVALVIFFVLALGSYVHEKDCNIIDVCRENANQLCYDKGMILIDLFIASNREMTAECLSQYEIHTYVVNCEGGD